MLRRPRVLCATFMLSQVGSARPVSRDWALPFAVSAPAQSESAPEESEATPLTRIWPAAEIQLEGPSVSLDTLITCVPQPCAQVSTRLAVAPGQREISGGELAAALARNYPRPFVLESGAAVRVQRPTPILRLDTPQLLRQAETFLANQPEFAGTKPRVVQIRLLAPSILPHATEIGQVAFRNLALPPLRAGELLQTAGAILSTTANAPEDHQVELRFAPLLTVYRAQRPLAARTQPVDSDFALALAPPGRAGHGGVSSLTFATSHQVLRRALRSGAVLAMTDLETPNLVVSGRPVQIRVTRGRMVLTVAATARGTAKLGELVSVYYPRTRTEVQARVVAKDQVELRL